MEQSFNIERLTATVKHKKFKPLPHRDKKVDMCADPFPNQLTQKQTCFYVFGCTTSQTNPFCCLPAICLSI